jgi:hypothetical protein
MFVLGTSFRVTVDHLATSALHSLADIALLPRDVGEVPGADVSTGRAPREGRGLPQFRVALYLRRKDLISSRKCG